MKSNEIIKPKSIRLDASTVCQLKCKSCPTASGTTHKNIGSGFLKFDDFKIIIDKNPWVSAVELSSWGEIFLNKDLLKIIQYAYQKNVVLSAINGVNLNNIDTDVSEALVKYKFRAISCSIDGASQDTYSIYRTGGNFYRVIESIKTLNHFKAIYKSEYPRLSWQFIAFGHNENEIKKAEQMAKQLQMSFHLKLSWDDLYGDTFSPVKNKDLIRKQSKVGVASRNEYREKYGKEHAIRDCCLQIWKSPQINYDGRVLGCGINQWSDYGNVVKDSLIKGINNEKINYARSMLMGLKEARPDIPCSQCKSYKGMKAMEGWITDKEINESFIPARILILLDNKYSRYKFIKLIIRIISGIQRSVKEENMSSAISRIFKKVFRVASSNATTLFKRRARIKNNVYPLNIPLPLVEATWKPYPLVNGKTRTLQAISGHASSLKPGNRPHPPHKHDEEELLFLLSGEVNLIFKDDLITGEQDVRHLKTGQFVYYPAHFAHTLEPRSENPANYLMFRWTGKPKNKEAILDFGQYDMFAQNYNLDNKKDLSSRLLFESPTKYLNRLHCHLSHLKPGSGYESHDDPYDVAIIVFEGEVETVGKRARPYDIIFYPQGEPHGMYNPGKKTAKYIVFEFDGGENQILRRITHFYKKMTSLRKWKRKFKKLIDWFALFKKHKA